MADLYPPIEPFATHAVAVGQGHVLYVEESGNPDGKPALVLHGGPGSGSSPGTRRFFDPTIYRIVLFDQRGCGKSTPLASEPDVDLSTNTTDDLLSDIEIIRDFLGVGAWLVYGHSWGSLLGLAYATRHRERVSEAILSGVVVGDPREITWLYRDIAGIRPLQFARFREGVPDGGSDDLIKAYSSALFDPDLRVQRRAAAAFSTWDWSMASVDEHLPMTGKWLDPEFQLARSRIVTHYFGHDCWLDSSSLLEQCAHLDDVPVVLVNGELDLQAPMRSAERLAESWPGAELVRIGGAGHSTGDAGMAEAIVDAADRFGLRS